MKQVINIAGYLLILAGCSFTAWSTYFILSATYVTLWAGGPFGFAAEPRIIITRPETDVVSQPSLQVAGCFPAEIKTVTCDIINAVGTNVNQADGQLEGIVTARIFDPARSEFTTNFFQLNDIKLAEGKNRITVHVRAAGGKQYSMRQSVTLVGTSGQTPSVDAGPAH